VKLLITFVSLMISASWAVEAPKATKIPKELVLHGDVRIDDYHWMLTYPGEPHSKEFLNHVEAENTYTESKLNPLKATQQKLVKEMIARTAESNLSVPEKVGDFEYYTKTLKGKDYPLVLRKNIKTKIEETLLDCNVLAQGQEYFELDGYEISPDQSLLLYSEYYAGGIYAIFVKDLKTQETRLIRKGDVSYAGYTWSADNHTIFLSTHDSAQRPYRVYSYDLLSGAEKLMLEEKDPVFEIESVEKSSDGKYLLISTASKSTSETYFLNLGGREGSLQSFLPRKTGHKYSIEHHEGRFYILSDKDGVNMGLYRAPVESKNSEEWELLIAPTPNRALSQLLVFEKYMALLLRQDGLSRIEVIDFSTLATSSIAFDEAFYELGFPGDNNLEYDRDSFLFEYESLTTPGRVYSFNAVTQVKSLVKETPVGGGFDAANYKVERLLLTVRDGASVPVSLIYRKETELNGKAPMFLTAYGNYGMSFPIGSAGTYSVASISPILDRGVIFAIAHIRGGGEMGPAWYLDGKLKNKKNTFNDFIDVTEHLIAKNYTSSEKLGVRSFSAGGLLVGYITNNRPDLYKAVIGNVPFVDLLTTMVDEKLPLTTQEWEEWGNPNIKDDYDYMKSYCPYTNVGRHAYPHMLVKTSLKDTQVLVHEPTKWVAKLRELKTDSNELLLEVNTKGGHSGNSGQYAELEEAAWELSWLLSKLGAKAR
jgi:oligopeptidase B